MEEQQDGPIEPESPITREEYYNWGHFGDDWAWASPDMCVEAEYLRYLAWESMPGVLAYYLEDPVYLAYENVESLIGHTVARTLNKQFCVWLAISHKPHRSSYVSNIHVRSDRRRKQVDKAIKKTTGGPEKFAKNIWEFWLKSIADDEGTVRGSPDFIVDPYHPDIERAITKAAMSTALSVLQIMAPEDQDLTISAKHYASALLKQLDDFYGTIAGHLDPIEDGSVSPGEAIPPGHPNWMSLQSYLKKTLMLDSEWCLDEQDSLTWWGGPIPVQVRVLGRYNLPEDGSDRDVVEVRALAGILNTESNLDNVQSVLQEWNRTHPIGGAFVGESGIVQIATRQSFNHLAPSGRAVIAGSMLYYAAWAPELASYLSERFDFRKIRQDNPSLGARTDFDELAGNYRGGRSFSLAPIDGFAGRETTEAFVASLSNHGWVSIKVAPPIPQQGPTISWQDSRFSVSVTHTACILLEAASPGPGILLQSRLAAGDYVDHICGLTHADMDDAGMHVRRASNLVMSSFAAAPGEDWSNYSQVYPVRLERHQDTPVLLIESFIPDLGLLDLVGVPTTSKMMGDAMHTRASLFAGFSGKHLAMLESAARNIDRI